MVGRTRCKTHGGATPTGAASPHFVHGGYSRFLPANLRGRYKEALADPNLLSLQDAIAVEQLRIQECCQRLETGECGTLWSDVRDANRQLQEAVQANDPAALRLAIQRLDDLSKRGGDVEKAYGDLFDAIKQKADTTRTELARMQVAQQLIPLEQVVALMLRVAASINQHITSPLERRAVQMDLAQAFNVREAITVDGGQ